MILEKRDLIKQLREKKSDCLDALIHVFCFFSVLLIGADKWGFDVGVNIRIDQFILLIFGFLTMIKGGFYFTKNTPLFLFVALALISTILSLNKVLGIFYFLSIVYNVIFLFYLFESYVKRYGLFKFIRILRATFYLQFLILLFQFALKVVFHYELSFLPSYGEYMGIPRFNLWFYEPSYLATYLAFWYVLSFYMLLIKGDRAYLLDLVLSLMMIVISTATTGFIAIALGFVLVFFMWLSRGVNKRTLIFILSMIVVVIVACIVFRDILAVFVGRLFGGNLDGASGGRLGGYLETVKVWLEKPLFGVGPGNYGEYFGQDNSYVPSNVTLELMATIGVFSTICFYALTFSLISRAKKINRKRKTYLSGLLYACALGLLVFTVVLQINQGYLRLYHWMIFGVISGGIGYIKANGNQNWHGGLDDEIKIATTIEK